MQPAGAMPRTVSPGSILDAIDDLSPVDQAHDAAGKVEVPFGIESRHLGCLTADESASCLTARFCQPAHDVYGDGWR